jgi:hypothetical protein
MEPEGSLVKLLYLLRAAIRAAGRTQTEVDARIGRRRGYLSHVFQRRVDLKLRDLLGALDMVEVDSGRFFQAAFARRSDDQPAIEELIEILAGRRSGRAPANACAAAPEGSPEHANETGMLERVRKMVRAILAEWPGEHGGGPRPEEVSSAEGSEELKPRSGGGCVLP